MLTASRERAEHWLLNSGIYILDRTDPHYGAVYSYFDCQTGSFDLVYAEATGYILSLLKYLHGLARNSELVEFARTSGDWLLRWGEGHHGILPMGYQHGLQIMEAYAFDQGICCKGLLDLYDLTHEGKYLRRAEEIARWLTERAANDDGSVKPVYDTRSGRFVEDEGTWFRVSGSFHAKIAMSLLHLSAITGERKPRDAALRLCAWALRQQQPDGSFRVNRTSRVVNLHFHCYALEALLYAYSYYPAQEFLDAVRRAVQWMTSVQARDGGFRLWYGRPLVRTRASYAAAQAVRIFLIMRWLDQQKDLARAAERAVGFLLSMQARGSDARVRGGFFEEDAAWSGRLLRPSRHVTSWAAMFAIHALELSARQTPLDAIQEMRRLF